MNTLGGGGGINTRYVLLYTDKCIPWDERIARVTVFFIAPARRRLPRVYLHFWRMDAVLPGANYQS